MQIPATVTEKEVVKTETVSKIVKMPTSKQELAVLLYLILEQGKSASAETPQLSKSVIANATGIKQNNLNVITNRLVKKELIRKVSHASGVVTGGTVYSVNKSVQDELSSGVIEGSITIENVPSIITLTVLENVASNEKPKAIPAPKSEWSAKNPYTSNLKENFVLNGEGSRKETRHIVFNLGDSGLEYKAGDALGVIPQCPPRLVEDLLLAANFSGEEIVETHLGEVNLKQALTSHLEIHRVSKKWIQNIGNRMTPSKGPIEIKISNRQRVSTEGGELLIDWSGSGEGEDIPQGYEEIGPACDPAEELWRKLTSDADEMENYMWSRDYIDAMDDFGHIGFTAQQFIDGMDRLKPRLYSIASSPDHEPGTVHLTVGIVRYSHHDRDRTGLCTGFLADRCEVDDTEIGVFMSPTRSFILPENGDTDCIMVGPGTGIAPFRAFLQQRDINGDKGRNWLFFGDWTEEGEYYYREEMDDWKERGVLNRHDLAWSRQGDEKVYVQHLMMKHGEEIWNWINGGGYFYVCGDKNYMAKDVHSTLIQICSEFGGMSSEVAKDFVEVGMMKTEKRYLRDVY